MWAPEEYGGFSGEDGFVAEHDKVAFAEKAREAVRDGEEDSSIAQNPIQKREEVTGDQTQKHRHHQQETHQIWRQQLLKLNCLCDGYRREEGGEQTREL